MRTVTIQIPLNLQDPSNKRNNFIKGGLANKESFNKDYLLSDLLDLKKANESAISKKYEYLNAVENLEEDEFNEMMESIELLDTNLNFIKEIIDNASNPIKGLIFLRQSLEAEGKCLKNLSGYLKDYGGDAKFMRYLENRSKACKGDVRNIDVELLEFNRQVKVNMDLLVEKGKGNETAKK